MAMSSDGSCRSLDELPLPALSEIVTRCGPRPDSLLRTCRSAWRLHSDLSTWHRWMLSTYGAPDALHKLRHCRWLDIDSEDQVLAAATLLLASGADPNLNEDRAGYWTPCILHWAVSKNFPRLADLLVHGGAVVDEDIVCAAAAQGNVAMLSTLVASVQEPEFERWRDMAFLHATSGGEVASAAWLLDRGADMNVNEGQGLFEAAYHGHLGIVELLIDRGVEFRARNDGALVAAAFKDHLHVAHLLLTKGADVNSQRGRALIQAAGCGHLDMVKLLLLYDPLPPVLKEALETASRKGYDEIVASLLHAGAQKSSLEGGALLNAATQDHSSVVKLLIRAGVNAQAALDAATVRQMIQTGRHSSLAAMEEEGQARGKDFGPAAWGLDLQTFRDPAALAVERSRLVQLMKSAATLSVLSVRNHGSENL